MRVVHLPFTYYPDAVGGTEIYVQALVQELGKLGCEGLIAAPSDMAAAYWRDGIKVHRLAPSTAGLGLRELYGEGDPHVGAQFAELLDAEKPDVVHLHAFTSAISLRLVRESARCGIPVVFTYHTPTVSCQRGTLVRWGKDICDGKMERRRCTQCTLHGLGLNRAASWAVGWLPPQLVRGLGRTGGRGRHWTALRMSELVELRHNATRALLREVDRVVVLCTWTRDLLIRNGVSQDKIALSRHGLLRRGQMPLSRRPDRAVGQPLRLAYLGRLHPTKGVELLVRAVRAAANAAVELDLYGIVQGPADEQHSKQLTRLSQDDGRIHYLDPVPVGHVRSTLERYDMLAVPSQGLETGPLVVLEAFEAGIPVLGSALGGIAELVQHDVNGLLVQPCDEVDAWTSTLETLVAKPGMVRQLTGGVRPPRGMDAVAKEMVVTYESVLRLSAA